MTVFGPVPSRRLGQSLGINIIPPKTCSYSCTYCQLGRTKKMTVDRQSFLPIDIILKNVEKKCQYAQQNSLKIGYLTIVSDGEPTLEIKLGELIRQLKIFKIPIAVITNSSLMNNENVRYDLSLADWVSIKIDSLNNLTWKIIDRPHGKIELSEILRGTQNFTKEYTGRLVTETMMVKNINDDRTSLEQVAGFINTISPEKAYLSIPTRPPAEKWVSPPSEKRMNASYHIFKRYGLDVEFLVGLEGNEFGYTGNIEKDLLSITSVHPMREAAVNEMLTKAEKDHSIVDNLVNKRLLAISYYEGERYYTRRFN